MTDRDKGGSCCVLYGVAIAALNLSAPTIQSPASSEEAVAKANFNLHSLGLDYWRRHSQRAH